MKIRNYCLFLLMFCLNTYAADWDTSGTITTDGGDIYYRIAGTGKPLLLLHGYSGSGDQWQQFVAEFLDDYRVIAVDLPGHGESSALGSSFVVTDAARDMWQLMDHLDVEHIHGVGYSAGGMTLLQMALLQPSRVRAMTLAASAYTVLEERIREQFKDLPEGYQQDLLRNHNGDKGKIGAMLGAKFVADINVLDLKDLEVPTLLVSGDRDESFPLPVVVETYSALPNAKLWIVPGIGHALFWPWGGSERLAKRFPSEVVLFFRELQ